MSSALLCQVSCYGRTRRTEYCRQDNASVAMQQRNFEGFCRFCERISLYVVHSVYTSNMQNQLGVDTETENRPRINSDHSYQ